MTPFTAVAVSGGVDSLVAAYLLKQKGHKVVGIHFIHGYEKQPHDGISDRPAPQTVAPISDIGSQLGIPIEITDSRKPFKDEVVDYFVATYRQGLTPNPCMVCNPRIKFGTILEFARQLGATSLATGHYARVTRDGKDRYHLFKGMDPHKDQSYFLAFLSQSQLAAARFPVGEMKKTELIRFAAEKRLRPVTRDESQDICFIRNKTYGEFLASQEGFSTEPGLIEDAAGNVIGKHGGLHLFTVGQRRGINCPASEPYYVIRLDAPGNRLVVGFKNELQRSACTVTGINWICSPPVNPVRVLARIRYRSRAVRTTLFPSGTGKATLHFSSPQSAVTPGQAAVFYQDEEVLGGGWIDPLSEAP